MLTIRGSGLTLSDYIRVAVEGETVTLDPSCVSLIEQSAQAVENIVRKENTVYGINTGFGALASVKISPEKTKELQRNIILSHAAESGTRSQRSRQRNDALPGQLPGERVFRGPLANRRTTSQDVERAHYTDRSGTGLRRS